MVPEFRPFKSERGRACRDESGERRTRRDAANVEGAESDLKIGVRGDEGKRPATNHMELPVLFFLIVRPRELGLPRWGQDILKNNPIYLPYRHE